MHLHRAAQELLCIHEYRERTVGDKIPRKMLVKKMTTDTLHSINWKKSVRDANDVLKNPGQSDVPVTFYAVSSVEQLLIDGEQFCSSNWMIYPGLVKARKVLRAMLYLDPVVILTGDVLGVVLADK